MFNSLSLSAPALVRLNSLEVRIQFGQAIEFAGSVESDQPLRAITLTLTPEGQASASLPIELGADNRFTVRFDLTRTPLKPFSRLSYTFTFLLESGVAETTQPFNLEYRDNRYNWQTLSASDLQVYWYNGDPAFGQAILNTAVEGRARVSELLPQQALPPVKLVVYASAGDLQNALTLSRLPYIAGHASPESGTVFVSIPPGPEAQVEMRRQIPHELMHIQLYQALGSAYPTAPDWLLEGTATSAELAPNADHTKALESASAANTLLPMVSLCAQFPEDAPAAFLAYAQSGSFVQYLITTRGKDSLAILIAAYRNGLGCEEAVYQTYGSELSRLDLEWRRAVLGYDPLTAGLNNLLPYALLAGAALLPGLLTLLLRPARPKETVE